MRKIKAKILISSVVILLFVLSGCGSNTVEEDQPAQNDESSSVTESIEITIAHEKTKATEEWAKKFKELAEQKLPGQIEVKIYPAGQLGNQQELYEQVQVDSLDIALGSSPQAKLEPLYQVFEFPYVFRDREHVKAVLEGPIPEELNKKIISKTGMRTLATFDAGFRSVANNVRPITEPGDFKGLKIRTPNNPLRIKLFNLYEAAATPIPFGDLFMSLQTKVVDGSELPLADFYGSSLYEVQQYLSLTNHLYTPAYAVVRDEWYQGLPDEIREAVQSAADESDDYLRKLIEELDEEYIIKLEEKGMKVNEVDVTPFAKIVQDNMWSELQQDQRELLQRIIEVQ